jgi:hypothetical protein
MKRNLVHILLQILKGSFKLFLGIKKEAYASFNYCYALSTLPDFKQLVQTCILRAQPFTKHLTLLMLEFQILFDLL